MTITLTVRTALWRAHVARVASTVDGLVPVVKGNGYGFGRVTLAEIASEFCDTVAVGTVHELDGLPDGLHAVVAMQCRAASAGGERLRQSAADPTAGSRHEGRLALEGARTRVAIPTAPDLVPLTATVRGSSEE